MSRRAATRVVTAGWIVVSGWLGILGTSGPARAGDSGVGIYGAPSLSIPVGARLMSLPDVVAAGSPDASLVFSNPAFLSGIDSPGMFFSTSSWLEDLRMHGAGGVWPVGRDWRVGLGATFLFSGSLNGYDDALAVVSEESAYDLALTPTVARRFSALGLSLGVGATYLRQHLYPSDGNGISFNAGASWQRAGFTAHAAYLHGGGRVRFDSERYVIDSQKIFGLARRVETGLGVVSIGAQTVVSAAAPTRFEIGADYRLNRFLSIRSSLMDVSGADTGAPGLDAGFGLHYGRISVGYAYTPREYFDAAHTFTVAFGLREPVVGGAGEFGDDAATGRGTPPMKPRRADRPAADTKAHAAAQGRIDRETPQAPSKGRSAVSGDPLPIAAPTIYVVVGGTHAWEESAQAEARSLRLLKVPATVERQGAKFRVVVGRYPERGRAESALKRFRRINSDLRLLTETQARGPSAVHR